VIDPYGSQVTNTYNSDGTLRKPRPCRRTGDGITPHHDDQ